MVEGPMLRAQGSLGQALLKPTAAQGLNELHCRQHIKRGFLKLPSRQCSFAVVTQPLGPVIELHHCEE